MSPPIQKVGAMQTSRPEIRRHPFVRSVAGIRFSFGQRPSFNVQMVLACGTAIVISVAGCLLTLTMMPNPGMVALGLAAAFLFLFPLILYFHEKGKIYLRDSILTVYWAIFFVVILGFPVTVAARIGLRIPLQDARFAECDRWLGVYVPAISSWAATHRLGQIVSKTYPMLFPFMQLSVLLPILFGKLRSSQNFITANLVAFAIGLPIFVLLPGIGPWYGYHLPARPDQVYCEMLVNLIRIPGPYLYRYPAGVICFPSFHVLWAFLCAQAFWEIRLLRVPAAIFSGLIILSTLTVGNHYFCDVLAGVFLAILSMLGARWLNLSPAETAFPR